MRAAEARRRASELYPGDSLPLVGIAAGEGKSALDINWWLSAPRAEGTSSDRHLAALKLYVEMGQAAAFDLGEFAFPAVFDLGGGAMRPDKGAIKAFLDNGMITHRMMGAQLIFELTDAGRARLDQANS
jgi:hypothetical protein